MTSRFHRTNKNITKSDVKLEILIKYEAHHIIVLSSTILDKSTALYRSMRDGAVPFNFHPLMFRIARACVECILLCNLITINTM